MAYLIACPPVICAVCGYTLATARSPVEDKLVAQHGKFPPESSFRCPNEGKTFEFEIAINTRVLTVGEVKKAESKPPLPLFSGARKIRDA